MLVCWRLPGPWRWRRTSMNCELLVPHAAARHTFGKAKQHTVRNKYTGVTALDN